MAAILAAASVVFVCEHGNVKSVIAMEWFNRLAAEHGMAVRAVSRGLTPESPASPVPPAIRAWLEVDGFDVAAFQARTLTPADARGVARLVIIGADAPAWAHGGGVAVELWRDIPPASESYEASRDAMKERILALLAGLGPPASQPRP